MIKSSFLIMSFLLITSCTQNNSQTEKEYLKGLERRIDTLEKELLNLKSKTEQSNNQKTKLKAEKSKVYFTLGSTEDKVIEVMGEPTSYIITAPEARKFLYGISTVYFYQGKVISYDNLGENLKVRVK